MFLETLGLRSRHWITEVDGVSLESQVIPYLNDRMQILEVLAPVIERFDAFTDVPFPGLYSELDQKYPNSKFILVTRSFDDWWESLKRHWNLDARHYKPLDPYEYIQYNHYSDRDMHYITLGDKELVRNMIRTHVGSVRDHFAGRSEKLLDVKLEDPDIGSKISGFLGLSCVASFPHHGD